MDKKQNENIRCKVENCIYHNQSNHCVAPHITVGPQHACCCQDTVCDTFKQSNQFHREG